MTSPRKDEEPVEPTPLDTRAPRHRLMVTSADWRYSLGAEGDTHPRGVYRQSYGQWSWQAHLPYIHERLLRRDASGAVLGAYYRASMDPDATAAIKLSAEDVRDGGWAAKMDVPLSGDPKVIQAVHTAIIDVAHQAPACETAPRVAGGELEIPPEDVAPAGYGKRADHPEGQVLEGWREVAAHAMDAPKLALVMGATFGGLYIRPLRRQSFMLCMTGDAAAGKTTTSRLAAALVGGIETGEVMKSWSTTENAVLQELAGLALLPALRDELGTAPMSLRRGLESLVIRICEGAVKSVGTRDQISFTTARWDGVLITSANNSPMASFTTEGASRRVMEIEAPMTSSKEQAERIKDDLLPVIYGWPLYWLRRQGFDVSGFRALLSTAEADMGDQAGGVAHTVMQNYAVAVAGAGLLERVLGVEGLRAAALSAARAALSSQIQELAEHGATAADRVYAAVAEAYAARPTAFPTRTSYRQAVKGELAASSRDVEGWTLTDDSAYPGDVAVLTYALERICERAGLDNPRMALRNLGKDSDGRLVRRESTREGTADARRTWKVAVGPDPDSSGRRNRPPVYIFRWEEDSGSGRGGDDSCRTDGYPHSRGYGDTGDDVHLRDGVNGPVFLAPAPQGPCRSCGVETRVWDPVGAIHPACLQEKGSTLSPTPPPTGVTVSPENEPEEPVRAPVRRAGRQGPVGRAKAAGEHLAAALDSSGLWLPDEARPIETELPRDAGAAYRLAAEYRIQQLWVHPSAHAGMGIPEERTYSPEVGPATAIEHPWCEADGYRVDGGSGAGIASWMAIADDRNPGAHRLSVYLVAYDDRIPFDRAADGAVLLEATTRLQSAMGERWYMSPNETTGSLLRKMAPRRGGESLLTLPWGGVGAQPPNPIGKVHVPSDWSRPLRDEEDMEEAWLHRYDANGSEPSVSTGVFIGVGEPVRGDITDFNGNHWKETAGYVLANVPRTHVALDPSLPDMLEPWRRVDANKRTRGGPAWAPVELLVLLEWLGVPIEPSEALYWPDSVRLLRSYGERFSKARRALLGGSPGSPQRLAEQALKATFTSRIGDWNRSSSRQYRPDIRDMVQCKARANVYRAAYRAAKKSGRYPVGMHVDALYYVSEDPDIWTAAPEGMGMGRDQSGAPVWNTQLGKFKPELSLHLSDVRSALGDKSFKATVKRLEDERTI